MADKIRVNVPFRVQATVSFGNYTKARPSNLPNQVGKYFSGTFLVKKGTEDAKALFAAIKKAVTEAGFDFDAKDPLANVSKIKDGDKKHKKTKTAPFPGYWVINHNPGEDCFTQNRLFIVNGLPSEVCKDGEVVIVGHFFYFTYEINEGISLDIDLLDIKTKGTPGGGDKSGLLAKYLAENGGAVFDASTDTGTGDAPEADDYEDDEDLPF